jgi:hypothetical protein
MPHSGLPPFTRTLDKTTGCSFSCLQGVADALPGVAITGVQITAVQKVPGIQLPFRWAGSCTNLTFSGLFHQSTYHQKAHVIFLPTIPATMPLLAILAAWVLHECGAQGLLSLHTYSQPAPQVGGRG